VRRRKHSHEISRLQVLDDLQGDEPSDAVIGQARQICERVRMFGAQATRPAHLDHLDVRIDADGRHAALAQQVQEFAAAAADVDHVVRADEPLREVALAIANVLGAAAVEILETDVLDTQRVGRAFDDRGRRRDERRGAVELPLRREGGALRRRRGHAYFVE
jgi:hypothetical protein